jgi:Xaa-Pro dipeptidase
LSSVWAPTFPRDEYCARLLKVQAAMAARGLDALLLLGRADICYLTGMENCYMVPTIGTIVPAAGEPVLIASDFEMANALVGVWCQDRVTFAVGSDPVAGICQALVERGMERATIGVSFADLAARQFQAMVRHLPSASFVEAADVVWRIKLVKSPAEIAYLREAGRLTTLGMQAALTEVATGKTDNDIAAAAAEAMIRGGSEFFCIDPIVTVGARSGLPHSTFRRTAIQGGDAILVELGACVARYSAPLMRTAVAGPVSDDIRRAADACQAGLEALLAAMRPGAVARYVASQAKAAWTPISDELVWHGIYAYSVGLGFPPDWNDAPLCITADSDEVLEAGMCLHATTSLRDTGRFGTAVSETVLITELGTEVLTGTPRSLWVD